MIISKCALITNEKPNITVRASAENGSCRKIYVDLQHKWYINNYSFDVLSLKAFANPVCEENTD